MGEELKLGNLFVVCDDGTYVPFEGITEIDLNDIPSDTVYDPIVPITNEPMTITFDMKRSDLKATLFRLLFRGKNMDYNELKVRFYSRKSHRKARWIRKWNRFIRRCYLKTGYFIP